MRRPPHPDTARLGAAVGGGPPLFALRLWLGILSPPAVVALTALTGLVVGLIAAAVCTGTFTMSMLAARQ